MRIGARYEPSPESTRTCVSGLIRRSRNITTPRRDFPTLRSIVLHRKEHDKISALRFFFGEPEAFGKSTIRFGRIPSVWVSHGCMASSPPILPRNLKDLFRVAPEKLGPPTCPILARDGRDKAVGRVFAPESAVDAEDDARHARRRKTDRQSVLHCGR